MASTLIGCVGLFYIFDWPNWIIGVELLLIAEFAVFWAIQTNDLRGAANRKERAEERGKETQVKTPQVDPHRHVDQIAARDGLAHR
ncbi:hypothetical protein [Alloactinosynnema sp. L-07]|nr:hypothetical protein [Alloactinosynnema sp. L-07]